MLDFRMETFLAVCRYMNFTRAAEKLNITQPAVSQHIRFLEKHYNTKLFRYEGKKLELTEAGEILKNASLTMMHDETAMQDEMKRAGESEELRWGTRCSPPHRRRHTAAARRRPLRCRAL